METYNLRVIADESFLDRQMTCDGEKHYLIRTIIFAADPKCQRDYLDSKIQPEDCFATMDEWREDREERIKARSEWMDRITAALGWVNDPGNNPDYPTRSANITHNWYEFFTTILMKAVD